MSINSVADPHNATSVALGPRLVNIVAVHSNKIAELNYKKFDIRLPLGL